MSEIPLELDQEIPRNSPDEVETFDQTITRGLNSTISYLDSPMDIREDLQAIPDHPEPNLREDLQTIPDRQEAEMELNGTFQVTSTIEVVNMDKECNFIKSCGEDKEANPLEFNNSPVINTCHQNTEEITNQKDPDITQTPVYIDKRLAKLDPISFSPLAVAFQKLKINTTVDETFLSCEPSETDDTLASDKGNKPEDVAGAESSKRRLSDGYIMSPPASLLSPEPAVTDEIEPEASSSEEGSLKYQKYLSLKLKKNSLNQERAMLTIEMNKIEQEIIELYPDKIKLRPMTAEEKLLEANTILGAELTQARNEIVKLREYLASAEKLIEEYGKKIVAQKQPQIKNQTFIPINK